MPPARGQNRGQNILVLQLRLILMAVVVVSLIILVFVGGTLVLMTLLVPTLLLLIFSFTPFGQTIPFWQKLLAIIAVLILGYGVIKFAVLPLSSIGSNPIEYSTVSSGFDVSMMYGFALIIMGIAVLGIFGVRHVRGRGGQ